MSYSSLYKIYKTKVVRVEEFRNSHGSAPPVWGYLSHTFLGGDKHSYMWGDAKPLWQLSHKPEVPEYLRICHAFTFDFAVCPPDRIEELARASDQTFAVLDTWPEWKDCVNHWNAIAAALRGIKPDGKLRGIGLGCTSVSDPWEYISKQDLIDRPWNLFAALQPEEGESAHVS